MIVLAEVVVVVVVVVIILVDVAVAAILTVAVINSSYDESRNISDFYSKIRYQTVVSHILFRPEQREAPSWNSIIIKKIKSLTPPYSRQSAVLQMLKRNIKINIEMSTFAWP